MLPGILWPWGTRLQDVERVSVRIVELRLLVATCCEALTISVSGSGIPFLYGGEDVNLYSFDKRESN